MTPRSDSGRAVSTLTPIRDRVTWSRWDHETRRVRVSRPYVWCVIEPDGYERTFGTRAEADAWIDAEYACTCGYAGPDADGNYDLIEDPSCPRHAETSETQNGTEFP
jgi:hypothetical protein